MIGRVYQKVIRKLYPNPLTGTENESERDGWIKKALQNVPAEARILDAGAGEQQYKKYCEHLDYVSQDFAAYKPEESDSALQEHKWDYGTLDIISDICEIPEADQSFDAVLCTEVFEHIPDPISALKEFDRLLKPGGHLIITAPFCSLTHFAPYHFYSGFNKYFYETHLGNLNYEILEMKENGNYFEYIAQELRRLKDMAAKYETGGLKGNETLAIRKMLLTLERLSKQDQGSEELLCFGFHVLAKKN